MYPTVQKNDYNCTLFHNLCLKLTWNSCFISLTGTFPVMNWIYGPKIHFFPISPLWNFSHVNQQIKTFFKTHGEGHTKSKIGAISGSTKWTLVQEKIWKKKIQIKNSGLTSDVFNVRRLMTTGLILMTSYRSQHYHLSGRL